MEKLKIAVLYGADAVYLGGTNFGLRAKAKNFDYDQMKEGVEFAHAHDVRFMLLVIFLLTMKILRKWQTILRSLKN